MQPLHLLKTKAPLSAYKKLAIKLKKPVTMMMLADLFCIDRQARNKNKKKPLAEIDQEVTFFYQMIHEAGVEYGPEKQILTGQDIITLISPGARMGEALKYAYDLQISKSIINKQLLIEFIKEWIISNN